MRTDRQLLHSQLHEPAAAAASVTLQPSGSFKLIMTQSLFVQGFLLMCLKRIVNYYLTDILLCVFNRQQGAFVSQQTSAEMKTYT